MMMMSIYLPIYPIIAIHISPESERKKGRKKKSTSHKSELPNQQLYSILFYNVCTLPTSSSTQTNPSNPLRIHIAHPATPLSLTINPTTASLASFFPPPPPPSPPSHRSNIPTTSPRCPTLMPGAAFSTFSFNCRRCASGIVDCALKSFSMSGSSRVSGSDDDNSGGGGCGRGDVEREAEAE